MCGGGGGKSPSPSLPIDHPVHIAKVARVGRKIWTSQNLTPKPMCMVLQTV